MKIGKLYFKIFLSFVAVLLVAEIIVFSLVLTDDIPPPLARNLVEKTAMASNLLQQQVDTGPAASQPVCETLSPLVALLAQGFQARMWVTDSQGALACASFSGAPPTVGSHMDLAAEDAARGVRLYVIKELLFRSVYTTSPLIAPGGAPLTLHILGDRHPRKEERWFLKGLLLLTALSALFLIPVSRHITRPVRLLSDASDRLGKGDFSQRVPVKGDDEVATLARKFNNMASSMETMLKTGNELTAHLSHELRSPLARMRVSLQLVMERAQTDDPEASAKLLGRMQGEIEKMDSLIGQILALSKMDMQQPVRRDDHVDLGVRVHASLERFESMLDNRGLDMQTELASVPKILCSANAISMLIDNVLSNAIKYTTDGGSIGVGLRAGSKSVEMRVCNDYQPLSQQELDSMFVPFHRLCKEKVDGTGLGLAMSRKIVELHGGRIDASYEDGRVCILISLPIGV